AWSLLVSRCSDLAAGWARYDSDSVAGAARVGSLALTFSSNFFSESFIWPSAAPAGACLSSDEDLSSAGRGFSASAGAGAGAVGLASPAPPWLGAMAGNGALTEPCAGSFLGATAGAAFRSTLSGLGAGGGGGGWALPVV